MVIVASAVPTIEGSKETVKVVFEATLVTKGCVKVKAGVTTKKLLDLNLMLRTIISNSKCFCCTTS
jgi:hypothetical protein